MQTKENSIENHMMHDARLLIAAGQRSDSDQTSRPRVRSCPVAFFYPQMPGFQLLSGHS